MTATLTTESTPEIPAVWHGPNTLEEQVKLDLAAKILRRAGGLALVAQMKGTETDFVSVVEWLDAAKADLASGGVSKRSINYSMPYALGTFSRTMFDHKPRLDAAVRLFSGAPSRLNAQRYSKFPTRVKDAVEPDTILQTRGLPREIREAGYASMEFAAVSPEAQAKIDARMEQDATRAADATKSAGWDRQLARRLHEKTRVDSELDYSAIDLLTKLDRELQLNYFPPLVLREIAYRPIEAALDGANQVLLAINPVVPGRYTVVRSTTKAIPPGLVLDGESQARVNKWLVAGGKIFVCRPGIDYALDATCERHPWGRTAETVWAVDGMTGKTLGSYLVGDRVYTYGAKAAESNGKFTCTEEAARRYRQVNCCPICLLPNENPVLAANREVISTFRRERVAAIMAAKTATGKQISARDAEQLMTVRDGESVPVGPEPPLKIEGTVYRVAEDLGARWWFDVSDVMKAIGAGAYPKHGNRERREAWIAQAESHLRRPKDTLTFTTKVVDEERETSPRVVGDPVRTWEDEEREAKALVKHLQRPV